METASTVFSLGVAATSPGVQLRFLILCFWVPPSTKVYGRYGDIIGLELRSLWLQNVGEDHQSNLPHIGLDCWSPNINIVRDARWGRNLETPGEDPLLNGLYGAYYTIGLQNGTDPRFSDPRFLQAVVTLKHYDANSLEGTWDKDGKYDLENGTLTRHTFNAVISRYDLASTYLRAFRRSVVQGGAKGVMCSYNEVNGKPSCANSLLLKDLLRDTWLFDGYVTSDSGAVQDITDNHHYCSNLTCAVGAALSSGCDVESAIWPPDHPWGTGSPYIKYSGDAIKDNLMTKDDLDTAVYNALMIRFRLGLFDPVEDQPYWHVDPNVVRSEATLSLLKILHFKDLSYYRMEMTPLAQFCHLTLPYPQLSSVHLQRHRVIS